MSDTGFLYPTQKGLFLEEAFQRPCVSIEAMDFEHIEQTPSGSNSDTYWFAVEIPKTFKEVTRVRAVDFQTVIGNAGGYVGLFLGNHKY